MHFNNVEVIFCNDMWIMWLKVPQPVFWLGPLWTYCWPNVQDFKCPSLAISHEITPLFCAYNGFSKTVTHSMCIYFLKSSDVLGCFKEGHLAWKMIDLSLNVKTRQAHANLYSFGAFLASLASFLRGDTLAPVCFLLGGKQCLLVYITVYIIQKCDDDTFCQILTYCTMFDVLYYY